MRALGCRTPQLYATVVWQALTVVVIGVVVGVPIGTIAGSALWRRFASDLGTIPTPSLPWAWTAIAIAATIVVSIAAAMLSARRAAADPPYAALREI
jgi:predicted lysophospholipase L1 biosynthesis ABC-type transport system permease subunit